MTFDYGVSLGTADKAGKLLPTLLWKSHLQAVPALSYPALRMNYVSDTPLIAGLSAWSSLK